MYKFTDEQVIEFRRAVGAGEILHTDLARKMGCKAETMRGLLEGRRYRHVPGALTKLPKCPGNRRMFTPEQVLFMRLIVAGGTVSATQLARHYKVHLKAMTQILKGVVYTDVPERVDLTGFMERRRGLTDEEVLRARRYYATRTVSYGMLALEFGIAKKNIADLIRGRTYKHLPLAVPEHVRYRHRLALGNKRQRQRIVRASSASSRAGSGRRLTSPSPSRSTEADCPT